MHVRTLDTPVTPILEDLYSEHRRFVWGLSYRMTGSAADAEDLVQETFLRAMERPPADRDRSWRPWLARVCSNLAMDKLRRRKRRRYVGPWLPTPVETGDAAADRDWNLAVEFAGEEVRYEAWESMSLGFLTALEALGPKQRAVLLLQDVFGFSAREAGEVLGMREGAVRTTLHRARARLADYDLARLPPSGEVQGRTRELLQRLMEGLAKGDVEAIVACLRHDAVAISDGGGQFHAALKPLQGAEKVARFYLGLYRMRDGLGSFEVREVAGMPAVVADFGDTRPGFAPRMVQVLEPDRDGKLVRMYSVLAEEKLGSVGFPGVDGATGS